MLLGGVVVSFLPLRFVDLKFAKRAFQKLVSQLYESELLHFASSWFVFLLLSGCQQQQLQLPPLFPNVEVL
jgi:hypothetical protein